MGRLFWTVRYLRPGQVWWRFARLVLYNRRPRGYSPSLRSRRCSPPPVFLPRPVCYVGDGEFHILRDARRVDPSCYGQARSPLLWDYHFHYFDGLLAQTPSSEDKAAWVGAWVEHVVPGARPAWDPYPTSRRISNWIKWYYSTDIPPPGGFFESLAAQAGCLRSRFEYHLMANHLLANATALSLAGAVLGGDEGDEWLRFALKVLAREIREQFLTDGAHYELSPAYHALVLEDLLDLVQVARLTGVALPVEVEVYASRASAWLEWITRPDGRVPLFNDAGYGLASETPALLAYAERLGLRASCRRHEGLRCSEPSGYFRYDGGRLTVLGDVGQIGPSYQPGHAHCDMLSFELSWAGAPLVVDTGTSTYEVGDLRMRERGTAAHNTVQLGAMEQSEIWAAFRVARRARILERSWDERMVRTRIRAFPPRWAEVERVFRFDGESVHIEDRFARGPGWDAPVARLHFHPDVRLREEEDGWIADGIRLSFEGADWVRRVGYEYAPEFNLRIPAFCLEIGFAERLVTRIAAE